MYNKGFYLLIISKSKFEYQNFTLCFNNTLTHLLYFHPISLIYAVLFSYSKRNLNLLLGNTEYYCKIMYSCVLWYITTLV